MIPKSLHNAAVLGHYVPPRQANSRYRHLRKVVVTQDILSRHLVMVAHSGHGKTLLLHRLAAAFAGLHGHVVYMEAKGDPGDAALFATLMHGAGMNPCQIGLFPFNCHYDVWRDGTDAFGKPRGAIAQRLVSALPLDESDHHRRMLETLVGAAVDSGDDFPRSANEFLRRIHPSHRLLVRPGQPDVTRLVPQQDRMATAATYHGMWQWLGSLLDGDVAPEDKDAMYISLPGTSNPTVANMAGRLLLADIVDSVCNRRNQCIPLLLVLDDLSAITGTTTRMTKDLMERLRSANVSVVISVQSAGDLGAARDEILAAAGTLVIGQCNDPELLLARLGDCGVFPDEIRGLHVGQWLVGGYHEAVRMVVPMFPFELWKHFPFWQDVVRSPTRTMPVTLPSLWNRMRKPAA